MMIKVQAKIILALFIINKFGTMSLNQEQLQPLRHVCDFRTRSTQSINCLISCDCKINDVFFLLFCRSVCRKSSD